MNKINLVILAVVFITILSAGCVDENTEKNTTHISEEVASDKTKDTTEWVWNNKGNDLIYQGKYSEAIQAFEKSIEINPQNADPWNGKGIALYNLDRYEEAIQASEKALEINPQYSDAWDTKGHSFYYLGRYEEAVQAYDKVIEIGRYPQCIMVRYNKGLSLYNLGKYEEAIQSYNSTIEYIPKHTDAWIAKGNAFSKLGRYDEAQVCYDKAKELGYNS